MVSTDSFFYFTDPKRPGQVFAIKRKETAPVSDNAAAGVSAASYQKAFMKSYQPVSAATESELVSQPNAMLNILPSCTNGLPRDILMGLDDVITNLEPGNPATPGDPAEPEELADEEEFTGTQGKRKRKRMPADEKTLIRLKAVLEKNPFDYPDKSVERREAWIAAVKLANGDDNIPVKEADTVALKAVVQRHLKVFKSIDNEDRPTGTERDLEVFDEYMQVMEQITSYKDSAPLAVRKPEKAKKDAAISLRARATRLAMTSGISLEKFGDLLTAETSGYDGDFENGDLEERCDEMHFDRDDLIKINKDGQLSLLRRLKRSPGNPA
ncbi:uncharacterized protein LOC129585234 [Paramacrobiotus metropolitanus]|uniref:uncharacterized protein LOC129585234 n=1 Tax=Paramacrobiotus metropolitanus TaxID=2943436 RepID=UPI00244615E1|nr:uncharacterized protein LOC129585234 [Paramacrobiotus metropolitanus]